MPQVVNIKDLPGTAWQQDKDYVYIGRRNWYYGVDESGFGNPFIVGRDGNRDEVLEKYKTYLNLNPELIQEAKKLLKGKILVCWCSPEQCHGDILLEVANS